MPSAARTPKARTPLDAERIARAALDLLRRRGADGLTMRAVADELGVSVMALYHHVPGKRHLLGLVLDTATGERPLPEPSGDGWEADLLELARWMRAGIYTHPDISSVRRAAGTWTPAVARVSERWLSIWQQSGLEFTDAARAGSISGAAVVGYVEQEVATSQRGELDADTLAPLPSLRAAVGVRDRHDPAQEFDLFVLALVAGLHQRLSGGARPSGPEAQPEGATRAHHRRR